MFNRCEWYHSTVSIILLPVGERSDATGGLSCSIAVASTHATGTLLIAFFRRSQTFIKIAVAGWLAGRCWRWWWATGSGGWWNEVVVDFVRMGFFLFLGWWWKRWKSVDGVKEKVKEGREGDVGMQGLWMYMCVSGKTNEVMCERDKMALISKKRPCSGCNHRLLDLKKQEWQSGITCGAWDDNTKK